MVFRKNLDMDGDEDIKSKINAAGLINSTLERLWSECYSAMSSGNYILWNTKLDAIWVILGGDVKENGDEDKSIRVIDLEIYNNGSLKNKIGRGFESKSNPNNAIQYQLLKKKSLFLRRLQNKQGKGTAYYDGEDEEAE